MEQRQKVLAGLTLSAFILASPGLMTTYAAGWTNETGNWQYLSSDGTPAADQWRSSGSDSYYLNSDGVMERNSLFQVDDNWYYVDEDGKMIRDQWMAFGADVIEANDYGYDTCWYYFGSDGRAYRKKSSTFRKTIGDNVYAFDEDGIMLTGFVDEDGQWIDDQEDPFIEARYYFGEDGAMYRNQWKNCDYQWLADRYLRSDMAERDYMDYEDVWLYFGSDGKKYRSSTTEKFSQKVINGETYAFDENGVMMTWWGQTSQDDKTSVKFYSGYDGGKLLKDSWVWMYPSEDMDEDDYQNLEYSWWRTDSNGKVFRNSIREIGNAKYAFDDIGRMQTGFLLYDGTKEFVGQYDIDVWESDDFKNGLLYGLEKADLYLFGPDEFNGGAMQKGDNISVELSDGVYTFGFRANGKAYGSRNQLEKANDSYYINGLKLEAHDSLKYGVVKVTDEEYRVVNTNGKIQKGKTKAIKDSEGGYYLIVNDKFKSYILDSDKPRWYNGPAGEGFYRYDSSSSEKYGEFICGKDSDPSSDDLPADAWLNFE